MFDNLTNKLENIFSKLKSAPSLSEDQVDSGLKEIKQALKEDLINVFKVKKDKEKKDLEDLNNGPIKVITTITWDEEEEEELDEEDKID